MMLVVGGSMSDMIEHHRQNSSAMNRGVLLTAYVLKHQKPFDPNYLKNHEKTA
jgi:hypothetical protein